MKEYDYYAEAEETGKKARRISRSQQRAFTMGHLKTKQGGLCALCKQPIDLTQRGKNSSYVLDHCHDTGLIRGVLHRGCNGALGKMENAIGRWAALGMDYNKIIPWVANALEYYYSGFQPVIYPDHKSKEEKAEANKVKAKKAAALKAARLRIQKEKNEGIV